MLLLIILLLLVFGFGGGYVGYSNWGPSGGISIGAIVLIILVVLLLSGRFR